MSQHDFLIDNQNAPASRADINSALQALASMSSGATAPVVTYANMLWYDTANDLIKMRNETNSVWITIGTVDQTNAVFNPNFLPATQAEAEAGTNNTQLMTPLRTAQAIAASGGAVNYQVFTASGTWTKPSGISADAIVIIEAWGGGGGGARSISSSYYGGGGGGGSYVYKIFKQGVLPSTVSVTVGAGGAAGASNGSTGVAGGNTTFGSYAYAYGGGRGRYSSNNVSSLGGGGGGSYGAGGDGTGGRLGGGDGGGDATMVYGGGGGGYGSGGDGGYSVFGGSGGAGVGGTADGTRGLSLYGGGGGAAGVAGTAPGGGGGANYQATAGAGGRGEVRVWTIG